MAIKIMLTTIHVAKQKTYAIERLFEIYEIDEDFLVRGHLFMTM